MKRKAVILSVAIALVTMFSSIQGRAGEVDVLVDKLVEKGVLSDSEAQQILTEMQEEDAREKTEIKQVATEAAKKEAETSKVKLPQWLEKMHFFGDLRLRHDTQWRTEQKPGKDEDKYHRNRERFRLRLGVTAKTTETTEVGVRLASGSGYQNTTNQSFDEHARGKHIFIDKAYASWKPLDCLKITGGKEKNPLFTTPLVWDPDVNPEGLSEKFRLGVTDRVDIFANMGQWVVEELNVKDRNSDPALLAYQIGSTIRPTETVRLDIGLAYYDYQNLDDLEWKTGALEDPETFLGYNNKHSQQMIFDGNGMLLNEFECWALQAKVKIKDVLPVPLSFFGSYINNTAADIDELIEKGVDTGDSDPKKLEKYGGDDRDSGWLVGLSVGSKKKKGDWYAKYFYQELEDYAFPAVFVDSDFHGGGTNNKGHYVQGRYFLTDNIQARATGFFTKRQDESKDGKKDEDRLQVDVVFTF